MVDLDKVNWEEIVISAINNPNVKTKDFEELKEKATLENRYFEEDKVIFENEKYKLIFKIGWDKSKFFFLYESVVVDKITHKRVLGIDEAHGYRHIHSGFFLIPNPETLIEKLEHQILSFIIKSETGDRRKEWIRRLANELKNSQKIWRDSLK